jgi:anthranilate synthase component 1
MSPFASIQLKDGMVAIQKHGESQRLRVAPEDPFSFVRNELAHSCDIRNEHLPGPFAGAVGYISYDVARFFEKVPAPGGEELGFPDYYFVFPGTLAVFDHVRSEIEILALPPQGEPEEAYSIASGQIDSVIRALESPLQMGGSAGTPAKRRPAAFNVTEEDFKARVLMAKEHILSGDIFQVVLSQRLTGETDSQPFQVYRVLRTLNPSPYMFYLDFGDFQLIGSSPEMLVKLEDGKATLCPIAGTRPRGSTPQADKEFEQELISSEKERAEHTMLVDLGRNDLGRVCDVGSVVTESFMQVEKYSHVMHLVSRVTGTLRRDQDMYCLLRAGFPAGTVTGAPKIRAMQIISDLEGCERGPYAGAVGYLGSQGDMDMCIAIRTLIMRGRQYFVQGGAGIVADSDPASEHQETLDKIKALTEAIAIAEKGF